MNVYAASFVLYSILTKSIWFFLSLQPSKMRFLEPVGYLYNNGNIVNSDTYATNGNHLQHNHHQSQTTNISHQQNSNVRRQNDIVNNSNTTTGISTYNDGNEDDHPNITITSDAVSFSKNLNRLRYNVTGGLTTEVANTIINGTTTAIVPPPIPPRPAARSLLHNNSTYHQHRQDNLNNLNSQNFTNKTFNDNDKSFIDNVVTNTTTAHNKITSLAIDNVDHNTNATNIGPTQVSFECCVINN